jgi:hypothetical protein
MKLLPDVYIAQDSCLEIATMQNGMEDKNVYCNAHRLRHLSD